MEDEAPAAPNEPTAPPPGNASNRRRRTATISRGSALHHEAQPLRTDHSATISTESHTIHQPGQQNGNVPGASFEPAGVFERPLITDEVHTFSSPAPPEGRSKPTYNLKQVKIVHSSPNQARIALLFDQEQKTVTVDGGNTDSSQLSVLGSIEGLPSIDGTNRIWTESTRTGRDKKRKTAYHCSRQGCMHQDSTAQKARQHFVACHVEGAGWECPIKGCRHARKHKRLDDLKNHHMVPVHDTKYYRGREPSEHLSNSLAIPGTGAPPPHPYASPASNNRIQDRQIYPPRTNAGGVTRRARNPHRHPGPLNMNLRRRSNTTTSMRVVEQEESRGHAPNVQSPMSNYQTIVDANAFSIAPIDGTSRSTPIFTGDFSNEPPSTFSPPPRSPFNDPAFRQSSVLPQDGYPPSVQTFNNWYDMKGSSPATYTPMSPHYAQPGTHTSSQSHDFPTHYPYDEEVARMQRRDGQPGHDPPVQDAQTDQAASINTNSITFSPTTGSPYDRWRHQQQQLMAYGGAPGTSRHLRLLPPQVEAPHDYVADSNASQPHAQSWTSYPLDGRNAHDYGQPSTSQPSTSYGPPRRLSDTSPSIHGNYGYPSNQGPSPFYGAFPFPSPQAAAYPNRVDEWPPYDESSPNPDKENFGDYSPRPEDHQPPT